MKVHAVWRLAGIVWFACAVPAQGGQVDDLPALLRHGTFTDSAAGYFGCVHSVEDETYLDACLAVYAVPDGVRLLLEVWSNQADPGSLTSYVEEVMLPADALSVIRTPGYTPLLVLHATTPRTGFIELNVSAYLGTFGSGPRLTICPLDQPVWSYVDGAEIGHHTYETGTVAGLRVREWPTNGCNVYFTATASGRWVLNTTTEQPASL